MTGASPVVPADVVVGIDVGGTKIAGAVVSADGDLGQARSVPTPASQGRGAMLDAVASLVAELAAAAGPGTRLRGVGVGTVGVVDVAAGHVLLATDALPGWTGTRVADGLRSRLAGTFGADLHVHVQNDVDAHAAGEVWRGVAAGLASVLVVAVGTGVGGAVVQDGTALRGAHHVAGEIGHLPVPGAEGLRCTCGRTGHLEALGSGPALHRRYLALGGIPGSTDARDVVARAAAGDPVAVRAVRDSAAAVGRGAAAVVTVLDPDAVVVTGGMAGAGEVWWTAMESALRSELIDPLAGIPVLRAVLGTDAAIIGAARGAWGLVGAAPRASS